MMKRCVTAMVILVLAGCASMDVVRIDAKGATELNGKPIPVSEISEHIGRDKVLIRANRATLHKNVIAVMAEAREAGVEDVSLVTDGDR